MFAGAITSGGEGIYSSFPYDPGLVQTGWADWKFNSPISRDSVAVGYIFSALPYAPALDALRDFVLGLDIDDANERIYATEGIYAESAMEFMTPTDLAFEELRASGGKMMVLHGASDGVFSMDGFIAPLREICDLAEKYRALVMIDDSHAVGFVGEQRELYTSLFRVMLITPILFAASLTLGQVLLALGDGEAMHGYAIMQEVETRTGGVIPMGPGTLYGSIKRMAVAGLRSRCSDHAA